MYSSGYYQPNNDNDNLEGYNSKNINNDNNITYLHNSYGVINTDIRDVNNCVRCGDSGMENYNERLRSCNHCKSNL